MRIAYIGRVTVDELNRDYSFHPPILPVTCTFGFGNRLIDALVARGLPEDAAQLLRQRGDDAADHRPGAVHRSGRCGHL